MIEPAANAATNLLFPGPLLVIERLHSAFLRVVALATLTLVFCAPLAASDPLPLYEFGNASRDGIGKFYMGREISHVMGHRGAGWLERPERIREERTARLLDLLRLQPGMTVADIGAGTGYFSLPMAERVGPEGQIFAVDIQPEMLAIIRSRMRAANISNIVPHLGTETDPGLPAGKVDTVLMVDAYHEFSHPREVMEGIVAALSENGRVVLVEYRGEDPSVPIKPLHKMTVEQASREMSSVGLRLDALYDDLPRQHMMVFIHDTSTVSPQTAPN